MTETQTLIGEATLEAPQNTQAWDGQLALIIGFPTAADTLNPAPELEAAIKAYADALDQPRADIPALRLRVSRAYAALEA